MKRKIIKLIISLGLLIVLSSCSLFEKEIVDKDLSALNQVQPSLTYYDINSTKTSSYKSLNSIGEQNILVIPVKIDGFFGGDIITRNRIQNAFFGDSEDTSFESVKSYYYKSSYGQLTISGTLSSWYPSNLEPNEIPLGPNDISGAGGVINLANNALEWYKNEASTDCTEFDKDGDGFIDSLWLVYDSPSKTNYDYSSYSGINDTNNPFWAYTSWDTSSIASISSPKVNAFAWASYDFMNDGYGETGIDAHTYIHETGHLLGLEDYYNYDGTSYPLGGIDMMDYNVGDHNSFSKFSLGWIEPYLVDKESVRVTLKSATETGEALILRPDDYNLTPFDEYFMVQFVTPTGLNYKDYYEGYYTYVNTNQKVRIYSKPGIMITHVTAIAGYSIGNTFYQSTNPEKINEYYASNTTDNNIALLMLMQKNYKQGSGVNSDKYSPSNDALFFEGDEFSLYSDSKYVNLMESRSNKLNNDTYFRYRVVVNSIGDDGADISIYYRG